MAVANGIGARRAAQAVDAVQHLVTAVCSTGFCGALDENLKIGNIFVAAGVRSGLQDFSVAQPAGAPPHATGLLASIDRVAQTAEEKRKLRESGAMAVEMEAGGAAAKALAYGLPFYCIRVVSDLANETFACDYNASIRDDGRFDIMRLLASAMRKPVTGIPELVRLQRRCRLASKNLGDFLARCEF